jgi:hypothetical protein
VAASALALLAAACGSSTPSKQAHRGTPSNLLGTYTATLKASDLPAKPPPELTDGSRTWKRAIADSGGVGGGRAFTIANASAGPGESLESSSFGVQGNSIVLHDEECDSSGTAALYENTYSYELTGRTLEFKTISNHCNDRVAQTILTSEPWKRTGR